MQTWVGRGLLALLVALIACLLVAYQPPSVAAHPPDPAACERAWLDAADGERFAAKQACLKRQARHRRMHATAPCPLMPSSVTVKHVRATPHQRRMLTRALNEARRMQAPPSHHVALVAGITQESKAVNLAYGDRDSVGILQLRRMHGTSAWRMRPENSAGWFLRGARQHDPHGTAPIATRRGRWGLIQRVQRSGHPYAYNQWIREARRTVNAYQQGCRS